MIHSINIDHRINFKRQISKLNTNDSYTHGAKKQRENDGKYIIILIQNN
jgi:hypothetical protein